MRMIRHQGLIVAVAAVVFFTNLGTPRLWDRDEPRNAGCAVEMLERGDWVVPVFNAELRTHKPVLLYWLMMTAYGALGVSEFAARFWSAVLGVGTALATYHMGRRLFNAEVGLWGGLILSTSLMFGVAARAATPDSVLIFFTTLATLVYILGTFKPRGSELAAGAAIELKQTGRFFPTSWPVVLLMYALMGAAVLAKGPVGLVLPTAVVGMFLLIVRLPESNRDGWRGLSLRGPDPSDPDQTGPRFAQAPPPRWSSAVRSILRPFAPLHFVRTCLAMRPFIALAASLAIALPWYLWVGLRTEGAWLEGFLFEHNLGRALSPMEGHGGGPWYYPVAVMVGFFPWSLLLTPMLIGLVSRIRSGDPWRWGYVFLACWVGVYVALFSLVGTKLPNYVTPMYPALALAMGCFVYHWTQGTAVARAVWTQGSMVTLALVGLVMLIAFPIAAWHYLPGDELLGLVGLIPLVGGGACYILMNRGRVPATARVYAVTAVVFTTALFGLVAVRVDRHQQFDVLLGAIHAGGEPVQLSSFGCHEPSWVFYAGQPIHEFSRYEGRDASAFLLSQANPFVITTEKRLEQLRPELPEDFEVLTSAPFFLKRSQLVVVGRRAERVLTADKSSQPVPRRR